MSKSSRLSVALVVLAALIAPGTASAAAPGFATPTMVYPFITGFEPDLAIDTSPKTAGQIYTSTPFGFSTTQSFIFRSNDGGDSFHFAEGNVLGKPTTCIGGGDSELQIDPSNGNVFFSDLQGLTNFSNSMSTDSGRTWNTSCSAVFGAGVDRQWIGLDTTGATTPVSDAATGGRAYEDYDNVNQNTDSNADNMLGNQLVMNESVDGVHYGSNCPAAGAPCGPPAVISRDEGIPGNVVVDNTTGPFRHRVYAIHTGSLNNSVILSWCSGKSGDATAAQVAADCTDPSQFDPSDPAHVSLNWHDTVVRPPGNYFTGNLFASMAVDQAGNVYVVWSEYPYSVDASGTKTENGPGVVKLAVSTDGGQHFGAPTTVSPPALGNNVMPWVTAGSAGRIGIAWYGASEAEENGVFGPDTLEHGVWNVYYAQSATAAGAGTPTFSVVTVSDHPVKFGTISTQGLGGSPDRSLGDFMQVQTGVNGEAVISYVDDTSADRNPDYCQGCGQTPAEAAGPIMVARQDVGSGLLAGNPELTGAALPFGTVSDPTGKGYPDAFLSANGTDTNATPNLDVAGVSVTQPDATHIKVTMATADPTLAKDLAIDPSQFGGPTGQWIVRWAAPQYDKPGDGNIFYVGMQAGPDGGPQFYTGTTCAIGTTHTKYFTYPPTAAVPGGIHGATVTWTVPLSAIGSPANGQSLFSITGFTAVQTTPGQSPGTPGCSDPASGSGNPQIPSLIDASPPMTYTIGGRAAAPAGSPGSGGRPGPIGGSSCDATRGFGSVKVTPHGHGLRIGFTRNVKRRVSVDVFQSSHGSRVFGNLLVARFKQRARGFTWSGGRVGGRHAPTDGYFYVRLTLGSGKHIVDVRRVALLRHGGRFRIRPTFFRYALCGEIASFKLSRPVFGNNRALGISYRLRDDAKVSISVLRGKRVVHRWRAVKRRQHRVYRLSLPAKHLPRGDYHVVLRAVEPGVRASSLLTARRI